MCMGFGKVVSASHDVDDSSSGVSIQEGLHYNPYFPSGAIAMPKMLIVGAVEYEDSTPATEAQRESFWFRAQAHCLFGGRVISNEALFQNPVPYNGADGSGTPTEFISLANSLLQFCFRRVH